MQYLRIKKDILINENSAEIVELLTELELNVITGQTRHIAFMDSKSGAYYQAIQFRDQKIGFKLFLIPKVYQKPEAVLLLYKHLVALAKTNNNSDYLDASEFLKEAEFFTTGQNPIFGKSLNT